MTLAHAKPSFADVYQLTRRRPRATPWPEDAVFDRDCAKGLVARRPGISDREIAEAVFGPGSRSEIVAAACRVLALEKSIERRVRRDGLFGNYLSES